AGGDALCWGENSAGELGDGTTGNVSSPETVIAGSVVGIAATAVRFALPHTCAVLASGAVECWGSNAYGQLGDGTTNDSASPVTAIQSGAAAVVCGSRHTCALMKDGTVRCWGDNALGATAGASTTMPVVIPN
ncbi:MAG: RCC1 repeat-containing protein, partial [Polyangiaceae bacterium]|nr:RCC1 repeat-containing protein [Polyangiaceae bacterium]